MFDPTDFACLYVFHPTCKVLVLRKPSGWNKASIIKWEPYIIITPTVFVDYYVTY